MDKYCKNKQENKPLILCNVKQCEKCKINNLLIDNKIQTIE